MDENSERNQDLERTDIFSFFNNYFLLFFSFTCILGSVFIQQVFFTAGQLRLGIIVAPVFGIVLPIYLVTRRFPMSFGEQLLIFRPGIRLGFYVVIATFFAVVLVDYIYVLSQEFMLPPVDYVEGLKELKPEGPVAVALTFLGLCVVVPISEEIIFRGIIQRVFARNMGGVVALFLAGAFFGVIHLTPQLLLSMIAFGIFLGFLYYATSNLVYPIIAHFVLNTVAFAQLVSSPVDEAAAPPFYAQGVWTPILAAAACGYLLFQIKKGGSVAAKTPYSYPDDSDAR